MPDTNATNSTLISAHLATANRRLREALHFHRSREQHTTAPAFSCVARFAKNAGEYAAYSGAPLSNFVDHEAMLVPEIAKAFGDAWLHTSNLLAAEDLPAAS